MGYFAVREEKNQEILGSDNERFFNDLKTFKGVVNRIKKSNLNKGTYNIYSFINVFDVESYKLLGCTYKN